MSSDTAYPSWGVLAKATPEHVMWLLGGLEPEFALEHFVFRVNGGWTAAFWMETTDTSEDIAAHFLRGAGFVPVYFFDFSKYGYTTKKWDGVEWQADVDPTEVLASVEIAVPGHDRPVLDPERAVAARHASVVEALGVDETRALVPGVALTIEAGPIGAIVYGADANTRCDLGERAPGRVFDVRFYPKSGEFYVDVVMGDRSVGTFLWEATHAISGAPLLESILGERRPEGIIAKLGLPASFLKRRS